MIHTGDIPTIHPNLEGRRARIMWGDDRYVRRVWNETGVLFNDEGTWRLRFDTPVALTPNIHMRTIRVLDRQAITILPAKVYE